jgi:protein CrcB
VKAALAVGLGGFLGSVARYKLGGLVLHQTAGYRFPVSTFVVNLLGCGLVGLLAGIAEHRHELSPTVRLFLITGFCGGFTTFSALGSRPCTCCGGTKSAGLPRTRSSACWRASPLSGWAGNWSGFDHRDVQPARAADGPEGAAKEA